MAEVAGSYVITFLFFWFLLFICSFVYFLIFLFFFINVSTFSISFLGFVSIFPSVVLFWSPFSANIFPSPLPAKVSHPLPPETAEGLVGVVPALEKARLYRGRGGELMRQAACRVVECLALTRSTSDVPIKTQVGWWGEVGGGERKAGAFPLRI